MRPSGKEISDLEFPLRSACRRVALALLDEQRDAPCVVEAADRACAVLHLRLDSWIGPDGCSRLLRRGLQRALADRPALPKAENVESCGDAFDGLPDHDAREAVLAFLAYTFDHLGRVIGDAVAIRLVLPDSPAEWAALDQPESGGKS